MNKTIRALTDCSFLEKKKANINVSLVFPEIMESWFYFPRYCEEILNKGNVSMQRLTWGSDFKDTTCHARKGVLNEAAAHKDFAVRNEKMWPHSSFSPFP